jgi:hypothetical protein
VKWLPLANPLLRALTSSRPLTGPLVLTTVTAVTCVLVSTTAVGHLLRRNA